MSIAPVLKYPGAKWSMADWVISHLPKHTTYLEPFFGSGAIFFNKQPSRVETINDLDSNITNLFKVIRDRPEELARVIEFTPWSREEYDVLLLLAGDIEIVPRTGDPIEDARRFLVRCWQAFGSKTSDRVGWKNEVQGKQGKNAVKIWCELPQRILKVAHRLKTVQVENRPALEVIERHRYRGVLIYADPPYPLETRHGRIYKHEMTDKDHLELLEVLDQHPGPVLLSGYACPLYDERLKHWSRRTAKALAEGGRKREEILWINPVAAEEVCGLRLF